MAKRTEQAPVASTPSVVNHGYKVVFITNPGSRRLRYEGRQRRMVIDDERQAIYLDYCRLSAQERRVYLDAAHKLIQIEQAKAVTK